MDEKSKEIKDFEEIEIEKEYYEIVEKAENAKKLTKEEFDKLIKEAKESIEFLKLIDKIQIPEEKYVVYTDGDMQLVYENGEFFLVSATDSTGEKRKIKRKQAIDSYVEYFIKYQLNPIIKIRKKASLNKERQQQKTQTRARVKNKENEKEIESKERELKIKEKLNNEKNIKNQQQKNDDTLSR